MTDSTPPPMPDFPPPPQPMVKKNHTNAIIIGSAAALIAAVVATGVVVVQSRDDKPDSSTAAAEPTPTDETITAAEEPEPEPENTEPEIMALTDGVEYEDGVEVTLTGYARGTSSEWAAPESTPYVSFTVKIVNKSDKTMDVGTGYVSCYYGDESREGELIFDDGLDGLPSMKLRAGRTASAKMACQLPKDEEYLQVEMAPSMESEVAVFAGNVK